MLAHKLPMKKMLTHSNPLLLAPTVLVAETWRAGMEDILAPGNPPL